MSNAFATAFVRLSWRWALLLVGSLLLPGAAPAQDYAAKGFEMATPSPRETTPENLAAGKALYGEYCSQCHGDEGDGAARRSSTSSHLSA